ncbi:hypothetical protein GCM10027046_32120 [Uliginosibacterium flavum]|uniref:Uncharacterized protein n=1 Tax=Uliginosibacterium flavum TaxID=1396831 RepID=A0ABV2TSG8_9RHOO
MQKNDDQRVKQKNRAKKVLAPMGNLKYVESSPRSVDLLLLNMEDDELNDEAVRKERLFAARFWPGATLPVRQQVIELIAKTEGKLTDHGIRILRKSSCLIDRDNVVKITLGKKTLFATQALMCVVTLICAMMMFAFAIFSPNLIKQGAGQVAMLVLWLGVAIPAYLYVHRPWRILKDAGLV